MKRYAAIICVTALVVLFAVSASCTFAQNKVAVISLSGPIQSESSGFFFGGSVITPESVRTELERASNDVGVKAIVLQVDSPGGSVAASQEIVNQLELVKKPIVVSMSDLAASGGYYISAGADKIEKQIKDCGFSCGIAKIISGKMEILKETPFLKHSNIKMQ